MLLCNYLYFSKYLAALRLQPLSLTLHVTSSEAENYWMKTFCDTEENNKPFARVFKVPSNYKVSKSLKKFLEKSAQKIKTFKEESTKEEEVQDFLNQFLPLVCEDLSVLYRYCDTSKTGAAAANHKVDCSFVQKSQSTNTTQDVSFSQLVFVSELKRPKRLNYKKSINQLIHGVVELIKKQKRKFVYIMRSDGHRISFIKFFENGTMIRSCDCNLFGGCNNLGDGFYFLVGLLCTKPELLGYQPLSLQLFCKN